MSMFFIGSKILLDDEESSFLALKLAKVQGFLDDDIRSLLKNEFYIPTNPLELKEYLRHITVFHSLFNGSAKATKEIKRVFEVVGGEHNSNSVQD